MRVLLDECVDPRVKQLFSGHEVATVRDQGCDALEDGPLLAAAQGQFHVLVTNDRGIEFQQTIRNSPASLERNAADPARFKFHYADSPYEHVQPGYLRHKPAK